MKYVSSPWGSGKSRAFFWLAFQRVDGYLILAPGTPASDLDEELAACRKAGVPVTNTSEATPLHAKNLVRSLCFPNQARFHPMKYLAGLARAITQRGGQLFSDTAVESAMEEKDGVVVKTDRGTVRASDVVFATNSPIGGSVTIHTKQAPYRTYAFAATLPRGSLPDALYWDTLDPYHYVRLQPHSEHQDIVIVGGEDHKSGQADDGDARFAALEAWVRERLPKMGKVTHRWSGQVMEPADYIGFIGRNSGDKHRYIATGDSGQGITNGVRVFAPDLLRLLQSSRGPALALDGTVPCSVANLQVCCRSGLTSESFGPLNGIHARRFIAALIEAACLVKGSLGRSHILGGGPMGTFRLLSRRGSTADLALHVLWRSGTSLRGLIHSGGRRMLLPGVRVRL